MEKNNVLVGSGRTGDMVHRTQEMGSDLGFRNVSKIWLSKCQTYDQAMEQLVQGHSQTEDLLANVTQMKCLVNADGHFVVRYEDGREFRPTPHAVEQMARWTNVSTWYTNSLLEDPKNNKGKQIFARDRGDAETLAMVLQNGFRRVDQEKDFLWRTRQDGTLRGVLSDQYAIINNEWFLDTLRKIVPGGLVSHWRGDCDTVFGNILIPDSIRQEDDSDYGGMLSVGNSEIGERPLDSQPSVFRAICQNGCIWDQTSGKSISIRHRGNIDLDELFLIMKTNLDEQIPLLPQGIDRFLEARTMAWDGGSMTPLLAQVGLEYKMTKKIGGELLIAYHKEKDAVGPLANTLFGLVNTITRAGQKLSNKEWVRLDMIGGHLAAYGLDDWAKLTSQARSLDAKKIDEFFALAN